MSAGTSSYKYPNDCLQYLPKTWWEQAVDKKVHRGSLIRAFSIYIGQEPHTLIPKGRSDGVSHDSADYTVEPFDMRKTVKLPTPPVGALPQHKGERYFVYRGKVRPHVVLATDAKDIPRELLKDASSSTKHTSWLVAPYFGADQDGGRGGWPTPVVDRIRRGMYRHWMWDHLPLGDVSDSILRFDQMQTIAANYDVIQLLPHRLSTEGLALLDQWLGWYVTGNLSPNSELHALRALNLAGRDAPAPPEKQ